MSAGTTYKTTKGYPRVTAGPLRNQYVHRVVAAAMLGRELRKDEEVHHRDGDRRNFWFSNLLVLGSTDHGWVSAKQAHFMRTLDAIEKDAWEKYMTEIPQESPDGSIREGWENRNGLTRPETAEAITS